MCDDNNRLAVFFHITHDIKKILGILWCQYCSRLIKDQYISASVQYLNYFYSLLFRNGHIIYFFVNIDIEAIFITDIHDLFFSFLEIEFSLKSQYDIFSRIENIDQFKMLMDHTNSQVKSIFWRAYNSFFSIDHYLTCIRIIYSCKHVHKSSLTATIFSKE